MSNPEKSNANIPAAKIVEKKRGRFSFVWIIPIVAALVGAWIGINTIRNQGPKITIIFKSAEGLEANKTQIRYNGVEVGEVTEVRLADDYQSVIATAKMSPRTEQFLRKDTKFWVVRPQISGANISGLSTIISGAFIGMEIGTEKTGERHFTALDTAPLETAGVTGRFFYLKTRDLGSLSVGTPIYYRRIQAGQVASYEMDKSGDFLNVKIFVQSPYDQYLTTDTRFWNASGLNLSLSASGVEIHTESFLSILIGGIAFENPPDGVNAKPAPENMAFNLASSRADAFRPPPVNPREYVLVFKESLRGLTVGAPVELNGINIGEVTDIRAQFDTKSYEFTAPVTIRVDMARYGVNLLNTSAEAKDSSSEAHRKGMEALIARGLRAQLKTGSLITGARFVALEFIPDAPPAALDWTQNPLQLPTLEGKLSSIESGVGDVVVNLNRTLTNASALLNNANQIIAPGSPVGVQLNNTLDQVGGAASALRILADYLERHPESLIHGKPGSAN
jgi:paraquat-inducible protein B